MPAVFAQQTPDENLSPGWTVQGTGSAQATTGIPGAGFAQSAAIPPTTNVGQATAGFPNPPGAVENAFTGVVSGSYAESVLQNGSYSVSPTTNISVAPAIAPIPGTTAAQSPYGVNATAYIVIPNTVTGIYVAPFSVTAPTGTSSPWVEVSAGGSAETVTATIPPAGWVKTTGAAATSVSYVPTN